MGDLGVDPSDVTRMRAKVCYQEVYAGPSMTMCVFLLRAGGVIPLHDHPGMHVFGRLLFGRMRSISLDLEEPNDEALPPPWPAAFWPDALYFARPRRAQRRGASTTLAGCFLAGCALFRSTSKSPTTRRFHHPGR